LRFFPEEKTNLSLDIYMKERVRTSPLKNIKKQYIEEARRNLPEVVPAISQKKKKEIYRNLIVPNR